LTRHGQLFPLVVCLDAFALTRVYAVWGIIVMGESNLVGSGWSKVERMYVYVHVEDRKGTCYGVNIYRSRHHWPISPFLPIWSWRSPSRPRFCPNPTHQPISRLDHTKPTTRVSASSEPKRTSPVECHNRQINPISAGATDNRGTIQTRQGMFPSVM
jgi:hypothetical protein